ncbi:Equilibrative nucleoside transporter 4 [Micractinium conductrix]|nr:Equilibrative nucleoside transporter 4 [Micractinium conductrix]|eukprot:PSC75565.1 Equilibrative nucleoside transporter 4 [Micractinium conductrix]
MLLVAACGVCDALVQGGLFGETAQLPPRFTQALLTGTAVSGVAISLLRVVTKAMLPGTEAGLRASANIYFSITALLCGGATLLYAQVLPRLPSVQRYRRQALEAALRGDEAAKAMSAAEDGDHSGSAGGSDGGSASAPESPRKQQQAGARMQARAPSRSSLDVELSYEDHPSNGWAGKQRGGGAPLRQLGGGEESAAQAVLPGGQHAASNRWQGAATAGTADGGAAATATTAGTCGGQQTAYSVFKLIWRLAVANAFIFVITLSIFPGVLAEDVHSVKLGSWYPVAMLAAFNVADCAGKIAPGLPVLRLRSPRAILCTVAARVLFIPAFYLAATLGGGPAVIGPLTVLLGLSNGYLTSCSMIEAPLRVPPAAADLAGNTMVLFLILGLCLGAAASFLWLL